MNSQQELLDAINTISQKADKSCDTPATVLRVEDETVWVHIDGGADETPVTKTINCVEGDTVQVRISNGSAFIVGNATAPPTDDSTANVAHFVAEQAEIEAAKASSTAEEAQIIAEEARQAVSASLITYETWYILSATTPTQPTEESHVGWSTVEPAWSSSSTDNLYFSVRTVKGDGTATWSAVGTVQSYADLAVLKNAIISTVASEYVGQGDSGITDLSSTMYQNVNGVNIYNDTLAVGDSYAHIDGDSFDIKEATTAGTIDDTNDTLRATFGAVSQIRQVLTHRVNNREYLYGSTFSFNEEQLTIDKFDEMYLNNKTAFFSANAVEFAKGSTGRSTRMGLGEIADSTYPHDPESPNNMHLYYSDGDLYVQERIRTAEVTDFYGNSLLDEWTEPEQISNGQVTFTDLDDTKGWGYKPYVWVGTNQSKLNPYIRIYTVIGAGTANMTITYSTDADNGGYVKLRIIK